MSKNPMDSIVIAEKLLNLVKSISAENVDQLTVWNTKTEIQNACDLLLANVMGRLEYTVLIAESCHESSALHFVTCLGIADLIGDGEATLAELSTKSGVYSQYLGVVMSCVLGRGYFEEVGGFGSRVYKNNLMSQILREDEPSTLKSAIGLIGDEAFRATSRLLDAAKIAASADTDKPQKQLLAVNIAFDFSSSTFEWMSKQENAWRNKRFGEAMQQLYRMSSINVSKDYPWHKLSSPIVDVGAGIGTLEMSILEDARNSHLEFVLFDIPDTMENAQKIWGSKPLEVASRVSFVKGDFMASSLADTNIPQGKPTYIIRNVLNNWTDSEAVHLLSMVRQAMPKTNSRLLLVEMLLRPDSRRLVHATSVQLLALNNGCMRTQEEIETLFRRTGFKVEKVIHMRATETVIEAAVA